jgi:hypothetical protein
MTRTSKPISLPANCRRSITMAAVVGATMLFAANAHAQTNAASGNTQAAGTNAATTGSTVENQELFSSTIDDFSTPEGRFATSGLATQPTAGGNTNATQQNARNLQRLSQQFNRSNQNRNTGNTQGTRTIRPSLRLGFTPKLRPAEDLRKSFGKQVKALTTRLPRLTGGRSEYASVKFDLAKPGEVVLSGSVPNEDAANLLTNILRMEPGVVSVRNDLKIAPAAESKAK